MATLNLNGTQFEVIEEGDGEPLVLVHGSGSDWRTWQSQLVDFRDEHRVIAYSRRYHWPNAPIPDGADYSMEQHVDDLLVLLHKLDAGPVHLVGHSYGGFVALRAAVRERERMRTLVLAEPPVTTLFVSNSPRPAELLKLLFTRPRTAVAIMRFGSRGIAPARVAARRGDLQEAMRIFGNAVLGREFYVRLSAARREQIAANSFRAEFLGSGFSTLNDRDVCSMQLPTLLVSGQWSPALFHRLLDRLEELLPDTERVEIGGASHIMHEDNPTEFNTAVRAFLASHRATG